MPAILGHQSSNTKTLKKPKIRNRGADNKAERALTTLSNIVIDSSPSSLDKAADFAVPSSGTSAPGRKRPINISDESENSDSFDFTIIHI
jgi:hypothetical protein